MPSRPPKTGAVDITGHLARQLTGNLVERADLILAMAPEHVEAIIRRNSDAFRKTYLIKAFPAPYSATQEKVQDPIGGTLDEYNQTYLELDEILRKIVNSIIGFPIPSKRILDDQFISHSYFAN